ncbi:MAG TPA: dirigent protein [Conexibacter sp.]|nr:dirigent protein [Conexibacter sp.]
MRRFLLIVAVTLPALLVGAAVLASGSSAEGETTRMLTFKELERGSTFVHIRNTRGAPQQSNLVGDAIVFTNPLADAAGRVVGRLHVECTTTTGARNFMRSVMTCAGVLVLRDGTLTVQTTVRPDVATTTAAVTGGTGAYANARGVLVSREASGGSNDTITLVD